METGLTGGEVWSLKIQTRRSVKGIARAQKRKKHRSDSQSEGNQQSGNKFRKGVSFQLQVVRPKLQLPQGNLYEEQEGGK